MTLSGSRLYRAECVGWYLSGELETIWKEAAYLRSFSVIFLKELKKITKNFSCVAVKTRTEYPPNTNLQFYRFNDRNYLKYCSVYSCCYATIARSMRCLVAPGEHVNNNRAIARQLLGKQVPEAKYMHTTTEVVLRAVFSVWSAPGLEAPAVLLPGKDPSVRIGLEAGWAPEPVRTLPGIEPGPSLP
jgi:hypothetical protein